MQIFEKTASPEVQLPQIDGISPMMAELLYRRHATDELSMRAFLEPSLQRLHDPMLLKDMNEAVSCIREALKNGKKICVYGDYDVDGICAVSMMLMCLRSMGADVRYYIPSRHEEGYGMNPEAIEALFKDGVGLIITVDNGIKALKEAELCYKLGMKLIVTDHHLCGEELPCAEAVICHTRADDQYPNGDICGAGTAYKLIEALTGAKEALVYLPLAGLATIADVVPLLGENRTFAALALEMMNRGECQMGLREIARRARPGKKLGSGDIGFGIAPRLNAAGRLADAAVCVELLCSEDEVFCSETAEELEKLNARRQQEETEICAQAFEILDKCDLSDKRSIVLRGDWNSGVIGIAASRIVERYYRPTILFSQNGGMLTGSARSIPGVHIYAALLPCADLFTRFGGHAAAAGASMDEDKYEAFCERFEKSVRETVPMDVFIPRRFYELDAELKDIDMTLAEQTEALAPFGEGNPMPVFHISKAYLRGLKRIGTQGTHLKGSLCSAEYARPCVFFGAGDCHDELLEMDSCEILCEPSVNRYLGSETLQLRLKAVRPCLPTDAESYIRSHREKFIDAISRNILYNGSCSFIPYKLTDKDEWLEKALKEDITGVLVLCCSAKGAVALLGRRKLFERMDIRFFHENEQPCAYHTAVFAPILDAMHPWRYRRILIYDAPPVRGMAQKLRELAPNAEIFVGEEEGSDELEALRFSRDTFKPMYFAFMRAGRSFYNRMELCSYISRVTRMPEYLCRPAVAIMLELGFAVEDEGIHFVPDAPNSGLENSETYMALQAIWSGE